MTDLSEVLPDFDLRPYRHLTHSLEKNNVTVAELIAIDTIDIAKRCPLPLGDLKRLVRDILAALHAPLPIQCTIQDVSDESGVGSVRQAKDVGNVPKPRTSTQSVRTLDGKIDRCLGGGFCTGHLSEIVGESAVGKTQFVLGLLLSVQLPPPRGLGKSAIYLSTEAPLNTNRLYQMLTAQPEYANLDEHTRPSLDRVHAISINNLELQLQIVQRQLPLAVERYDAGLVVMDSVAANFRAEHETRTPKGLADRAAELSKLGSMLRALAISHNVAVVVTNQVSDRFDAIDSRSSLTIDHIRSSSPAFGSSPLSYQSQPGSTGPNTLMGDFRHSLDHQQLFFTGWGSDITARNKQEQPKVPALGLAWANQISARIVLKMESQRIYHRVATLQPEEAVTGSSNLWRDKKKRRFLGVVFAPWTPPTSSKDMVRYEIRSEGPVSVSGAQTTEAAESEHDVVAHTELLDPKFWVDGGVDDNEFP